MNQFSRPLYYLLDAQGNAYPSDDTTAVSNLLQDVDARRVALLEKEIDDHLIYLSTVFLVIDHGYAWRDKQSQPVLFESMLFVDGQEVSGATERYHTKDEAIDGHKAIEAAIEELLSQIGTQRLTSRQIINLLQAPT